MSVSKPHFLLFSSGESGNHRGEWNFSLQAADGSATLEAGDQEHGVHGERLELLAVVRGLEALEQPSRVTLVTTSKYVNRGIAYGLEEWRGNDWTWESFGDMVPIKNRDLWQRLDQALHFHHIEFGKCRVEQGQALRGPHFRLKSQTSAAQPVTVAASALPRRPRRTLGTRFARWRRRLGENWLLRLARLGTPALPRPWLG
ncbi:MAG TPA: RNase H family protein, partial [Pirellulales bacterium]